MASPAWAERRRSVRVPARIRVKLSNSKAPAFDTTVLLRDLSADGVGFVAASDRSGQFDALGRTADTLEVEMSLGPGRTVTAPAKLVWGCLESEGPEQVLTGGLRFVALTERDRMELVSFVAEKARSMAYERLRANDRPASQGDDAT